MLISAENCDEFLAKIAVAPYVGAWIETAHEIARCYNEIVSLPTWERGLKLFCLYLICIFHLSLPTWERGLKQRCKDGCKQIYEVAPYVGAWIETGIVILQNLEQ